MPATPALPLLTWALDYAAAGYSVHWCRPHHKAPLLSGWSAAPVMTPEALQDTYKPHNNLGIRCGHWSQPMPGHGLVVVDIDIKHEDVHCEPFELLGRVYQGPVADVLSGSGLGRHWYFACPLDALPPRANWTFASSHETLPDGHTPLWAIEILSTGKQVIAPPSIHPSGGRYRWLTPWDPLPPWPADFMEQYPTTPERPPPPAPAASRPYAQTSIIDRFNAAVTWADILEPHGWQWRGQHGDRGHWCRPGKDHRDGTSATTSENVFYCFSSSTCFTPEKGYSKFMVYARLDHGGNQQQAFHSLQTLYTQRTPA